MLGHVAQSVGAAASVILLRPVNTKHWTFTNNSLIQVGGADAPVNGTWTAPADGLVDVTAMAPGGGGRGGQTSAKGGASGAAGRTPLLEVKKGQTISYSLGSRGGGSPYSLIAAGDVTVTFPDGSVAKAQGGKVNNSGTPTAAPGTATGFKENYSGLATGTVTGGTSPILGLNLTQLPLFAQPVGGGEHGLGFGNGGNGREVNDQSGGAGAPCALTIDFYTYE